METQIFRAHNVQCFLQVYRLIDEGWTIKHMAPFKEELVFVLERKI